MIAERNRVKNTAKEYLANESFMHGKPMKAFGKTVDLKRCDTQTHRQTDSCIELRYAQLIICASE